MSAVTNSLNLWHKPIFRPRKTPTLTSKLAKTFGIITAGDATCQFLVEKSDKWNYKRSFRQAFVGSCMMQPMNMFYLSRIAPTVNLRLSGFNSLKDSKRTVNLFGNIT